VNEGETYDLGEVRLGGESPVPAKELLKIGGLKSGDLANFDDVTAGLDRMKKRLRREGYMRASLQAERHIDDKKMTVDLSIRPELGPQFLLGMLAIEGLDIHGEAAVRKMWGIKEGKPFPADYPDYFLQQVREDGLFDGLGPTRSDAKVDEQTHVVNVTLYFQASKGSDGASPTRLRRPER
jgi:outer membrane protein assembly factor BamA